MASAARPRRRCEEAKGILEALQMAISNSLETPLLRVQPTDPKNLNPSYNREEQNTLAEVDEFARRFLWLIRPAGSKAKIDPISKAQNTEVGQDNEDDLLEINHGKLRTVLESIKGLSTSTATDLLRKGSRDRIPDLRKQLEEAKSLTENGLKSLLTVNKEEGERGGTASRDLSVTPDVREDLSIGSLEAGEAFFQPAAKTQQQERGISDNRDEQRPQTPKKKPQGQKRGSSLLSPEHRSRPLKRLA